MIVYEVYGESDIGCARDQNQDTIDWHVADDGAFALAIVADGMGGYKGGEIASRIAVECVRTTCLKALEADEELNPDQAEALLLQAGAKANEAIFQQRLQNMELSRMGTTLVFALAYSNNLSLVHAGDSRCYRVLENKLEPLTRDHSLVQQMLDDGVIDKGDIENIPFRNMLTRAVGVERDLQYSVTTIATEPGQQFLLCSDGLFNAMDDAYICAALNEIDPIDQQVHNLIKRSLSQHASDNVSAILLKV